MFWGTLAATLSLAFVLYVPSLSLALVFISLFVFGFSISAFLLCFSMIKEIHPTVIVGTSFGFMNAFDAMFGAFSDPLTGKVLDLWWTGAEADGARIFSLSSYHAALSILVVYMVIALILMKPIRETFCKQVVPPGMP
jgi:sugar phosphate permease